MRLGKVLSSLGFVSGFSVIGFSRILFWRLNVGHPRVRRAPEPRYANPRPAAILNRLVIP
ncbi:hypothetical protein EMIT051CA3_10123 [Pseudomonas chlororaphis]